MKKLLLIVAMVTSLGAVANAQIMQKTPEQRAAHMTRMLQKRLNLTPAQATTVNSAFLARATRMDSLKSNLSADKKLNNLTRRSITLSTQRQVVSVLNPVQKRQFMQIEKVMVEKHKEKKMQKLESQG